MLYLFFFSFVPESCFLRNSHAINGLPLRFRVITHILRCVIVGISDAMGIGALSLESVGHKDLLIIGPGVLGRIVAEMWKQVITHCI